ncbi:unnamed protein product [Dovyalis caffra]|uniref:Uncharacterized protein n=1 Tax=Dovyalis caffra TaxID=77055 RepID=A0AAV1SLD1_9ROSI|nr:unnamed protein product [Dovyalis caffra]
MAIKAIKCAPCILNVKVESLTRIVDVLRDNGVPKNNIALLFRYRPYVIISYPVSFKRLTKEVTLMGFQPSKSQFVLAITVLRSMSTSAWDKKIDVRRKWGLSPEEILSAFVKNPWFMGLSEEKIMGVMDLFVNKLGWESSYLAKNPTISSFSLEKRLLPRALVLEVLVSKGMVEKSFRSLAFFKTPENLDRFLCKSLALGSSNRANLSVHKALPYFLENPSTLSCLRYISSVNTDDVKEHSFTVTYLMNKCGFSQKSALEVSKHVDFESPDQPDSVLDVFKNHSFSKDHILKLVRRRPKVLLSKPDKTLLPKLEFFQSKGFSSPDVVDIISSNPWILERGLENQLVPAFGFFENFLQSDAMTIKAIKRSPYILHVNVETIARIVEVLRDNGVPEKNIALLVRYKPSAIISNVENFKKLIQEVTLMGFRPSKSQFVVAIIILKSMSTSTWEKSLMRIGDGVCLKKKFLQHL